MATPYPDRFEGDSSPTDEMIDIPDVERDGSWTVVKAKRQPKAMSFVRSPHFLSAWWVIQNVPLTKPIFSST